MYMLLLPRPTAKCRDSATNPSTFMRLVYEPGLTLGFEVPKEQHVYRQPPSFSILATVQADTPTDDLSNDEHHFRLNTGAQYGTKNELPR